MNVTKLRTLLHLGMLNQKQVDWNNPEVAKTWSRKSDHMKGKPDTVIEQLRAEPFECSWRYVWVLEMI